jgi:hypothetical protein
MPNEVRVIGWRTVDWTHADAEKSPFVSAVRGELEKAGLEPLMAMSSDWTAINGTVEITVQGILYFYSVRLIAWACCCVLYLSSSILFVCSSSTLSAIRSVIIILLLRAPESNVESASMYSCPYSSYGELELAFWNSIAQDILPVVSS